MGSALIEMGDLEAAGRVVRGWDRRGESWGRRVALVGMMVGGFLEGERKGEGEGQRGVMGSLVKLCEGDFGGALDMLEGEEGDLAVANRAVVLFYLGRVERAVEVLEGLVDKGRCGGGVTFNLATCFELTRESAGGGKEDLRRRVGEVMAREGRGGERGRGDFKL